MLQRENIRKITLVGVVRRAHPMGAGLGHLGTFQHPFSSVSVYVEPKLQDRWVGRLPVVA